jgi:uncharacterized DUF497 family protein
MTYEWNTAKGAVNIRKHGVAFADAIGVFDDENALVIEDNDHEEERFIIIGMGFTLSVLLVIYTYRHNDIIRIISARKATHNERKSYETRI